MSSLVTPYPGPTALPSPAGSRVLTNGKSAAAVIPQAGTLTFVGSSQVGIDAKADLSTVGIGNSTTSLALTVSLKANQNYSFSFYWPSNGPNISLVNSRGKATSVNAAKGFSVAASGTYTLRFDAAYPLKTIGSLDRLSITAKSVLPKTSGNKNIDALVMGQTGNWWHPTNAAATPGSTVVAPKAVGLDAQSSMTNLTYSFLSAAPTGQAMNNFQPMTAAQKAAARSALDHYSKLTNLTFTEVADGSQGNINFGTNNQGGVSAGYSNVPGTSGVKDKVYLYLANDQWTNSQDAQMQPGHYGWTTLVHEMGHALGLKHPGNYNAGGGGAPGPFLPAAVDNHQFSIMSYRDNAVSNGVQATTPMLYDVAALQYLYGANQSGSTATDGKFSFSAGGSYLQTLWSTNGSDTIDLSALRNASRVDLNAGAFSSVNITGPANSPSYSGNNNVALAYGSKINNVTLSSTAGVVESVTLNNAFASGSYDSVASFDAATDTILLKKSLFGSLSAKNLEFGTAATKSTSKIVVNTSTGEVFYDADGSGRRAATKIAQYTLLQGSGAVTGRNFAFAA